MPRIPYKPLATWLLVLALLATSSARQLTQADEEQPCVAAGSASAKVSEAALEGVKTAVAQAFAACRAGNETCASAAEASAEELALQVEEVLTAKVAGAVSGGGGWWGLGWVGKGIWRPCLPGQPVV